jgi:hypothetical protein
MRSLEKIVGAVFEKFTDDFVTVYWACRKIR